MLLKKVGDNMSSSTERKNGAVFSYVLIIISTLVQLLYTPFLILKLGQSEYGLYSLINSIIGYLTILDLGFGNAIIVYTSKYKAQNKKEEEEKLHGMFKIVFFIIGIIAAILGLILFLNIDNLFGNTMTSLELHESKIMMLILSFNLFITFEFSIYSSIITAYEKFTFQKIMAIISTLLKPLIMIPLLILGYKAITMTVVLTIINMIVLLSNYLFCKNKLNIKIKYKGFDKKLFKVVFGYSIWIFLAVVVDKINWSVDHFILGSISGTIVVSIYAAASTINQLFVSLSTAISGVLLPKISKMIARNSSSEELTNEFIKVGRIQYYIIFLMCSGLVLFGKEFFIAWVGESYIDAYYVAMILIIPLCIPLIQNLGISIRQAMNKHKFSSIVNIIVAVINIVISIPLAKKYGPIGAAVGTCFGIFLSSIINNIYYYKVLKLDILKFFKEIIKMSIIFLIPLTIIITLINIINLNGLTKIFVFVPIYIIIYSVISYFISMNNYEKGIIKRFFKTKDVK